MTWLHLLWVLYLAALSMLCMGIAVIIILILDIYEKIKKRGKKNG